MSTPTGMKGERHHATAGGGRLLPGSALDRSPWRPGRGEGPPDQAEGPPGGAGTDREAELTAAAGQQERPMAGLNHHHQQQQQQQSAGGQQTAALLTGTAAADRGPSASQQAAEMAAECW